MGRLGRGRNGTTFEGVQPRMCGGNNVGGKTITRWLEILGGRLTNSDTAIAALAVQCLCDRILRCTPADAKVRLNQRTCARIARVERILGICSPRVFDDRDPERHCEKMSTEFLARPCASCPLIQSR